MRDKKLAMRIFKLCNTFGVKVDSNNKHVFTNGPVQGESRGRALSVGAGVHLAAHEQSMLVENATCEAALEVGSEQCSSAQLQQESGHVNGRNQAQAGGSWAPRKTKNHWEQDDKCHWESGGAQGNCSSKRIGLSGDSSWEQANSGSWGSTKRPWVTEQSKPHFKQYTEGACNQLRSTEADTNCRKTWVPAGTRAFMTAHA
mmetsp:Transcript_60762/g.117132  ORF Transcript_60762/g.117132 Transcript_60762/m.117132 type:complete len:201 (+) Transcript_60762:3-605(+)